MATLLLLIIYLSFVSLGLPDSLLGAGWPVMHGELGVPTAAAGAISMIISMGTIISSLASERLTRRFGSARVTAVSVLMTALALLGFAVSPSFYFLCLLAVPYGLGAGAVDAALNNYVALHYASRHMSWLHAMWGVGASLSPYIMSLSLRHGLGWRNGYRTVGFIQLGLTAVLWLSLPLWTRVHGSRRSAATSADAPSGRVASEDPPAAGGPPATGAPASGTAKTSPKEARGIFRVLRIPGVPWMLVAFMSYCGMETTVILWASTYLVNARGIAPEIAAGFGAFYLIGLTVGRFLSGFIADKVGDRRMIRYGTWLILAGLIPVLLPFDSGMPALVGLIIAGLGSSPIYPSIIHATPDNFGKATSQAVIGLQMASAYVGSTLMPPLFGVIGTWSYGIFPFYLLILALSLLVMTETLNRTLDRRREAAGMPD